MDGSCSWPKLAIGSDQRRSQRSPVDPGSRKRLSWCVHVCIIFVLDDVRSDGGRG
jgi:hypothetical protein